MNYEVIGEILSWLAIAFGAVGVGGMYAMHRAGLLDDD